MFTKRQILDFCNREMIYFPEKYKNTTTGDIDLFHLAVEFMYQHAMEQLDILDQVLEAVEDWWINTRFNPKQNFKL